MARRGYSEIERKCVFIIGMHRSGTSAFTGTLETLGFAIGDNPMPANRYNEKGYFEDQDISNLNDNILNSFARTWDSFVPFSLVDKTFIVEEIKSLFLRKFAGKTLVAIKDPRLSLLLPLWLRALDELGIVYSVVLAFRRPMEVCDSLKTRNNFSTTKSLLLWATYSLQAEKYSRSAERMFIEYEDFLRDPKSHILELFRLMSIDPKTQPNIGKKIAAFLDRSLKHHGKIKQDLPDGWVWISDIYNAFSQKAADVRVFDHAFDELNKTIASSYPEDLTRTLFASLNFPHSTLFVSTGNEFNELQKIHVPLSFNRGNFISHFQSLERFPGVRSVRIIPIQNRFVRLQLTSCFAIDVSGNKKEIMIDRLKTNGRRAPDLTIEFYTVKPCIDIPVDVPISEIVVTGKMWLVEAGDLVKNLDKEVNQKMKEIQMADEIKNQLIAEKISWLDKAKEQMTVMEKLLVEKNDYVDQINNVRFDLDKERAKIVELFTEKVSLLSEINEQKISLVRLSEERERLIAELQSKKSEIHAIGKELNRVSASVAEERSKWSEERSGLMEEQSNLCEEINDYKERLAMQTTKFNESVSKIKSLEDQLKSVVRKYEEDLLRMSNDSSAKAEELAYYKRQFGETPISVRNKWIRRILFRFDRFFVNETFIPESYLLNKSVFDADYYLKANPHLKSIIKNDSKKAIKHWIEKGVFEGLPAASTFHVKYYLQVHPDLKQYFKRDYKGAIKHWVEHGVKERRIAIPTDERKGSPTAVPSNLIGPNGVFQLLKRKLKNSKVQFTEPSKSDPRIGSKEESDLIAQQTLPVSKTSKTNGLGPDGSGTLDKLRKHRATESAGEVLRIGWLINRHDKMTQKYRVHNMIKALSRFKVESNVLYEEHLDKSDLSTFHLLVICRVALSPAHLTIIDQFRAADKTVIFDIDDLVFDPDRLELIRHVAKYSVQKREQFRHFMASLRDTIWRCDVVTTSTFALKLEVERLGKPAFIIPNNINDDDYKKALEWVESQERQSDANRPVRIGYLSGTASHEYDFMECSNALFEIMRTRNDVEFMLIGHLEAAERFEVFGERFIRLPLMSHEKMLEQLKTVHINLAPLEVQNPFVHCKSELKIFEAALYEVPTIASQTASYASIIVNGQNGLLANEHQQWIEGINALADSRELRAELGKNARKEIASRFMSSVVAQEAIVLFRAANKKRIRPLTPATKRLAAHDRLPISIVTILYKKRHEVIYFLESMRRQSFNDLYEIIFVDDASPDDSVEIVKTFMRDRLGLPDSNPNMRIRIVRNEQNKGNCSSRNIGLKASTGDIVIVVDADCIFNRDYLAIHYQAHERGLCDVAIGPKGIETNGRHPLSVLGIHEIDSSLAITEARPQDGINQESFVNCVTRNISIKREFIEENFSLDLFDELFNYSTAPESGFGWEDVEMGRRFYEVGARIKFLSNTASIHISHASTVNNPNRPFQSLRNFRRLHQKHPLLYLEARQWCFSTYEAIINWCGKTGESLKSNEDYLFLENHFQTQKQPPVKFTKPKKTLRVLSYRWHCPHQYELYHIGHDFTLVTGLGTNLCEKWEWNQRPMPSNAKLIHTGEVNPEEYDLAILHFDENILDTELCNGKVPSDWGRTFLHALNEWNIPKIAICHGTPQFYGQYNLDYEKNNLGRTIESNRKKLSDLLRKVMVVCNSHQAEKEWNFKKSCTIWHGLAPHNFPKGPGGNGMYSMNNRAIRNRPHYNGYFVLQKVREILGENIPISEIEVENPPQTYPSSTYEWAKTKFENYARTIGSYDIYLNPTLRSPMPRTRGEAMMTGIVTVSMRNHDVDMFIKNGANGFFADSAEEMAEQIKYLLSNDMALKNMANQSRLTALDVFNHDRYLSQWNNLIQSVV